MTAVDEQIGTIASAEIRPYGEVKRGYTLVREGDVLFAKITPCMQNGKHAVARGLAGGVGFASTEFHVVRPGTHVLADWIHRYLRQPSVLSEAALSFTGSAGQQRVPADFLRRIELPVPPLAEQQRIIALLDEQMAVVNRARAAAEAGWATAGRLAEACLQDVFGGPIGKGWKVRRLGDFADTRSGTTPARGRHDYYGGTIPWVKTTELRDGVITDTAERVTDLALRACRLSLLPRDTVLIAMYGQGQTRGRTAMLGVPATVNQACFAILPNPSVFDSVFLQLWFRHAYRRLRAETEGRGGNQPNLNGLLLRDQVVPLPPVDEQKRTAALLQARLVHGARLTSHIENELLAVKRLSATLLRRAFSGDF